MSVSQQSTTNFENQTQFQIYWKFDTILKYSKNVVDLTERKIIIFANKQNEYEKARVQTMLQQYRNGQIAIAWRNGCPFYVYVDPNSPEKSYK